MIEPRRSTFKKTTTTYKKDNLFDIIHIGESLNKQRTLFKTDKENFIYRCSLEEVGRKGSDVIRVINKNKFGINIDELYISTFELHYRLVDRFKPLELMGTGAFSIVIKACDLDNGENIAIKIIPKSVCHQESAIIENEIKIHSKLKHKNIANVINYIDCQDYLYIFMEIMEGGSLKDMIIDRYSNDNNYLFTDDECSKIMKNLIEGLDYLHSNNIMHRDIKPDNIIFKVKDDLDTLKIADFGLARNTNDTSIDSKCGTLIFMAPEMMNLASYDCNIDLFAAGFVMYILCSGGMHPFYEDGMDKETYMLKYKTRNNWSFPDHFPLLARNLFMKLCKDNRTFRYDTFRALRHPWITRNPNMNIPITFIESCKKKNYIEEFKCVKCFNLDAWSLDFPSVL